MSSLFSSEFFTNNRLKLRDSLPVDTPIVIAANGLLQRGGDMGFPFVQDANFWYLTGLEEAEVVLVIYQDEEFLIMPPRSHVQDIFEGEVSASTLRKRSGVKRVMDSEDGWGRLLKLLDKTRRLATVTPPPSYVEQIGMFPNPTKARMLHRIRKLYPNIGITDARKSLMGLRMIKQKPELEAIQKAVDISCAGFDRVQSNQYEYEYELEAELTKLFRVGGATGHAYDPIVAAGLNACTMHYQKNNDKIGKHLVLVDAGAEVEHYAADITRTWSQGKPTDRERAVLDAVREALAYGESLLKPGVSFASCEGKVRKRVGVELKKLGLITSATDKDGIRKYYPTAPHYLGLNVHDIGDYEVPLAANMVLTLEPGIYIPEEKIGVRIEDDILITKTGHKLLSAALPHTLS